MLKNILNLNGAQSLSIHEQKEIKGGRLPRKCELPIDTSGSEPYAYPSNSSACAGTAYPVFVPNYYGTNKGACCTY